MEGCKNKAMEDASTLPLVLCGVIGRIAQRMAGLLEMLGTASSASS